MGNERGTRVIVGETVWGSKTTQSFNWTEVLYLK